MDAKELKPVRDVFVRAIDLEALGISIVYTMTDDPDRLAECKRNADAIAAAMRHSDAAQGPKLRIGTSIRFTQTLREGATGDHPAFLYAEAGESGEITGYNDFEGYMVKTDSWPHAFGARRSEFEVVAPGAAAQGEVVRVGWPWLAELHADADNLFHRVQQGMLSPGDAARHVRDKIESAQAALAAPSTGDLGMES
jgi:hypothetical protein